jgi:hypothetical protein
MDSNAEVFNQKRMDRCAKIQRAIMDNWSKTNSFYYIVRVTESVEGCTIEDLRKKYFAVGISENDLQEIPFTDLLVIFSMIIQENAQLEKRKGKKEKKFKISYQITTEFSDEIAAQLLSDIKIQTPFDDGKYLKITPV